MSSRRVNRSLKRWPGWVALVLVVVGFLAVGATRADDARTPGDRIDSISRRIACPVCDGESVYESRNNASEAIRAEITAQVNAGDRSDDEIIDFVADRYGGQVLIVPRATGLDALAWALPAAAFVCAVAGLAFTFRRWRTQAGDAREVTDDDRAIVAAALARDDRTEADEPGSGTTIS
jgi:cytochrome c-type biogenesis protein CcmH